ncbi:MAG: hypothetical protein HRT58_06715 [Crocinitomicaceae bacterium]|nr:hypothetical protein [Flavobacteriales bacterium]NQZ35338.1 hypothetical protein [Crocinitomicaceae bacterium]
MKFIFFLTVVLATISLFSCDNPKSNIEKKEELFIPIQCETIIGETLKLDTLDIEFSSTRLEGGPVSVYVKVDNTCDLNFVLYKDNVYQISRQTTSGYIISNHSGSINFGEITGDSITLTAGPLSHIKHNESMNCQLNKYQTGRIYKDCIVDFSLCPNHRSGYENIKFALFVQDSILHISDVTYH